MSRQLLREINGRWIYEGDEFQFKDLAGNIQRFEYAWDDDEKKMVHNELTKKKR